MMPPEEEKKETEETEEELTVEPVEEEAPPKIQEKAKDDWKPKTLLGKQVQSGKITDIDTILESGAKMLETEIIDVLLPNVETDLLLIGQSKGKFGGGARRVFRQTQKKTKEGNKPSFATYAVVGDRNGHVGVGYGKSKETVPAREKAFRQAKLNIIKIRRGSGSWEARVNEPHSIPFKVTGKCGSVEVTLMPAPRGTGLVCHKEVSKILKLAGVKDVWSKIDGKAGTRINLIKASFEALKKLKTTKVQHKHIEELNIYD